MADIAKLRELLAKATPGPWQVYGAEQNCFGPADEIYVAQCFARSGYYAGRQDWKDNAALIAEAITALPALLDIAEAVARSPVARIETDGFADDGMPIVCLAADSIKAERAIKKMHMLRVRIVPCTGGAE